MVAPHLPIKIKQIPAAVSAHVGFWTQERPKLLKPETHYVLFFIGPVAGSDCGSWWEVHTALTDTVCVIMHAQQNVCLTNTAPRNSEAMSCFHVQQLRLIKLGLQLRNSMQRWHFAPDRITSQLHSHGAHSSKCTVSAWTFMSKMTKSRVSSLAFAQIQQQRGEVELWWHISEMKKYLITIQVYE